MRRRCALSSPADRTRDAATRSSPRAEPPSCPSRAARRARYAGVDRAQRGRRRLRRDAQHDRCAGVPTPRRRRRQVRARGGRRLAAGETSARAARNARRVRAQAALDARARARNTPRGEQMLRGPQVLAHVALDAAARAPPIRAAAAAREKSSGDEGRFRFRSPPTPAEEAQEPRRWCADSSRGRLGGRLGARSPWRGASARAGTTGTRGADAVPAIARVAPNVRSPRVASGRSGPRHGRTSVPFGGAAPTPGRRAPRNRRTRERRALRPIAASRRGVGGATFSVVPAITHTSTRTSVPKTLGRRCHVRVARSCVDRIVEDHSRDFVWRAFQEPQTQHSLEFPSPRTREAPSSDFSLFPVRIAPVSWLNLAVTSVARAWPDRAMAGRSRWVRDGRRGDARGRHLIRGSDVRPEGRGQVRRGAGRVL